MDLPILSAYLNTFLSLKSLRAHRTEKIARQKNTEICRKCLHPAKKEKRNKNYHLRSCLGENKSKTGEKIPIENNGFLQSESRQQVFASLSIKRKVNIMIFSKLTNN